MALTRKDFLKGVLTASVVGLTAACGDDDETTNGATNTTNTGTGGNGTGGDGTGGTGGNGGNGGDGGDGSGGDGTGGTGGGTGGAGGGSNGCQAGAQNSNISGHPGHVVMISAADITAGVDKAYGIQGGSGHDHTIMVTAANFAALANGESVMVTSTGGAHDHVVTLSCG